MKKKRKVRWFLMAGPGALLCLTILFCVLVKRYGVQDTEKGADAGPEQAVSDALVQIRAGERSGSGVIYANQDEKLIILTAAHVLEQAKGEIQIRFCDDFTVQSSVYRKTEDADLAFIQISLSEIPPENAAAYPTVRTDKKAYDALLRGDSIWIMGKEWDGTVSIFRGTLEEPWIYTEDFGQYMMLVRGTAKPGMSGGGAFDEAGNFIGILCGGSMEEDPAEEEASENTGGELAVLPLGIIEARYQEMNYCNSAVFHAVK